MNELSEAAAFGRILVALDASLRGLSELEVAAGWAARCRAELVAVLIEDVNLVRCAGLPFAREVDRISASPRQLDSPRLQRALRAREEQVRHALYQAAVRRQLRVSLRVVQGHYVGEALAAAAAMDVVFLGRAGGAADFTDRSLRRPVRGWHEPRRRVTQPEPLWVLCTGSDCAERALKLARELSQAENRELCVLLPLEGSRDGARGLRTWARSALGAVQAGVRFIVIPAADATPILRALRSQRCSLLLLPRDPGVLADAAVNALLERIDVPVVLIP